jgi:hypothetical protein
MTTPPIPPNGPAAGARRTRPTPTLKDDLSIAEGGRTVGRSREKLEEDRRARPRKRLLTGLVVIGVVGGFAILYAVTARPKRKTTGDALATAPKIASTDVGDLNPALTQPDRSSAPAAPLDSFPAIEVPLAANPSAGAAPRGTGGLGAQSGRGGAGYPLRDSATSPGMTYGPKSVPADPFPAPPGARGTTGAAGSRGAPSGTPRYSDVPLLPPDSLRNVASTPGTPTLLDRMKAAKSFAVQPVSNSAATGTLYPTRRTALVADGSSMLPTGVSASGPSSASTAGDPSAWRFTPGIRAAASVAVASPSAASGEPIQLVLDEPLVDRGVTVLPAGTRVIATGSAWDDGSNKPRLMLKATTFVLPDNGVRTFAASVFSPEDERPGIVVPYNHQYARKGSAIAGAAAAAAAFAKISPSQPQTVSGLSVQVDPTYQARQQAASDVYNSLRQEMNLNRPPVAVLFELAAGTKVTLVFGMP